jgi:hypothetical protein
MPPNVEVLDLLMWKAVCTSEPSAHKSPVQKQCQPAARGSHALYIPHAGLGAQYISSPCSGPFSQSSSLLVLDTGKDNQTDRWTDRLARRQVDKERRRKQARESEREREREHVHLPRRLQRSSFMVNSACPRMVPAIFGYFSWQVLACSWFWRAVA